MKTEEKGSWNRKKVRSQGGDERKRGEGQSFYKRHLLESGKRRGLKIFLVSIQKATKRKSRRQ